jgi:chromosome segregation ATPase
MSRGTKDLLHGNKPNVTYVGGVGGSGRVADSLAQRASMNRKATLSSVAEYVPSPPADDPPDFFGEQQRRDSAPGDDLIGVLKTKVEKQRMELDMRTDNVNAIQRNFQRLSEMYSGDRAKLEAAEKRVADLTREIENMQVEHKLFVALRSEFASLKSKYDEAERLKSESGKEGEEQRAALQKQLAGKDVLIKRLEATIAAAGQASQQMTLEREQFNDGVSSLQSNFNQLLDKLHLMQQAVDIKPPLLGDGISVLRANEGLAPQTRLTAVNESVILAASRGTAPVLAALQDLSRNVKAVREENERKQAVLEAEKQKLAHTVAELSERVKSLEDALVTESDSSRRAREQAARDRQNLVDQLQENATTEMGRLQRELERVSQELGDQRAAAESIESRLQGELAASRREVGQLQQSLDALRTQTAQNAASWQDERDRLTRSAAEKGQALAESAARLATVTAEVDDVKGQLVRMRRQYEEQCALGESLRAKCAAGSTESERAGSEAKALREELLRERGKAQTREAQLEVAFQRQIQVLSEQLAQEQSKASSLQEERGKLMDRLASLETLLSEKAAVERDALRSAANSANALSQQLDAALERVSLAERERDSALRQLQEQQRDLTALRASLQAREAELAGTTALSKELEAKSRELAEAKSAQFKAENELRDASRELAKCRTELTSAKESLLANERKILEAVQKVAQAERDRAQMELQAAEHKRTAEQWMKTHKEFLEENRNLDEEKERAAQRTSQLKVLQEECGKAVRKLIAAEEASESGYCCQSCMNVLNKPVVCVPCGHNFCEACFKETNGGKPPGPRKEMYCPECDRQHVTQVIPSRTLDLLSGKFNYRKQVLRDLLSLLDRDGGGRRGSALQL